MVDGEKVLLIAAITLNLIAGGLSAAGDNYGLAAVGFIVASLCAAVYWRNFWRNATQEVYMVLRDDMIDSLSNAEVIRIDPDDLKKAQAETNGVEQTLTNPRDLMRIASR